MKSKTPLLIGSVLVIIFAVWWFLHKPEVQTQHQPEPPTNSLTSANPAIQVAASNTVTTQPSVAVTNATPANNEADVMARYKKGLIGKDAAMQEILLDKNKTPQEIFGKVIDQYGQPVVGVDVAGHLIKMAEHELAFDGNRVATKRGVPVFRVHLCPSVVK